MKTAKEHIEIEFLKSLTYTEINEMFNRLKEQLDKKDKDFNELNVIAKEMYDDLLIQEEFISDGFDSTLKYYRKHLSTPEA